MVNSRDAEETAHIKSLSSDTQTVPLLKMLKQHSLRDTHKHYVTSESRDTNNYVTKRSHLVRQHYFNKNNEISKHDPIPVSTRTRRFTVEIIVINRMKYLVINCDCGYIERECHSCRHAQSMLNLVPTSEFFIQKAGSLTFILCSKMKNTLESCMITK